MEGVREGGRDREKRGGLEEGKGEREREEDRGEGKEKL